MTPFREFFGRAFDYKGRTSKHALWIAMWIMGTANVVLIGVVASATGSTPEEPSVPTSLLVLVSWIPWLSLGVRRLHDSNRSGWWMLAPITVIGFIPLVWWHLLSGGTHGPNRFGEDPEKRTPKDQVAQAVPAAEANLDHLRKLAELRDKGALTDEEYEQRKASLLAKI